MAIKISEIFGGNKENGTIQGEGMWMGTSSVFIRTFGCNKRCAGFGLPRGQKTDEYVQINPANYKNFSELPLVHYGCDTYGSIYPKFKNLSPEKSIKEIVDDVQNLLVDGKFNQDTHLILTGGEPLLWQKQFPSLLDEIKNRNMNLTDLTFETNGTQLLNAELINYFNIISGYESNTRGVRTTFSVSAKLPCSGETWESSILPDRVMQYSTIHNSIVYLKFVVATLEDFKDMSKAVKEFKEAGFSGSVYAMPIGGEVDSYNLNNKQVAELAIKNGYRYSPRLQVDLWKNSWSK